MDLDSVVVPDTPTARAALEVATGYHGPALLNHCVRAYLWAVAFAEAADLTYDAELLYVAALLHDIGLEPAFDNHTLAFEEAGGHVARVLTTGAGWPADRRTRVAEVIVRHMWPAVDPTQDPEGHLLEVATGLDISGRDPQAVPARFRSQVLARYPRHDLATVFVRCLRAESARKPDSAAARLVRAGLADRMAANPLDQP